MRIIGGEFKGRNLLPPPGKSITRPITGSAKKSLFGTLGEYLEGQVVLDLYCGTGTLGIEALSRGAAKCFFAELDGAVVDRLKRNLQDVGAMNRSTIWRGDVEKELPRWLTQVNSPVDLAFVDPPYVTARQWDWSSAERTLFVPLAACMAPDGVVVLRHDDIAEIPPTLGPLRTAREKRYGNMVVTLLVLDSPAAAPQ